jgi:hypothetical protein
MRHSRIFAIGFLCGIALFIALNVYSYSQAIPPCCDLSASFGIPFTAGSYGGFVTATYILWSGVIADMFVALAASYVLGWVVEKIFMSRYKLR